MARSNFFGSINVGSNYSQEAREHNVLSTEQIQRIAPTVFAPTKHESRSQRYVHIPTFDVIEGLRTNEVNRRTFTRGITGTADLLANRAMWLFTQQVAMSKAG